MFHSAVGWAEERSAVGWAEERSPTNNTIEVDYFLFHYNSSLLLCELFSIKTGDEFL